MLGVVAVVGITVSLDKYFARLVEEVAMIMGMIKKNDISVDKCW